MNRDVVVIIKNALRPEELDALEEECDHFRALILTSPCERASSIDIFENIAIPENHDARTQSNAYFNLRFKDRQQDLEKLKLSSINAELMQHLLVSKLPNLLRALLADTSSSDLTVSSTPLYIFNEHYVVKEPDSDIAFRWHTDANEQLALLHGFENFPPYYSFWCPIDSVSENNGTLYFPQGTSIQSLEYSSLMLADVKHQQEVDVPFKTRAEEDCEDMSKIKRRKFETKDSIGPPLDDNEVGIPIELERGSVVIFTSKTWHRSGVNSSDQPRRGKSSSISLLCQ